MWDFRRKGWTFRSGGDGPEAPSGSGLFKSTDGGATWTDLERERRQGPPVQAVGPRRGDRRAVQAERRLRVHRSGRCRRTASIAPTTAARPGRRCDRSQYMVWRPFYFASLIVDPKNENKVYKPDLAPHRQRPTAARASRDIGGGAHGDFHDVWIDPDEHRPPHRGRRRRRLVFLRRRQQVVEGRQPADLAVLPRERRHGPPVQRLRRPPGQQLLGRRLRVSRRHHQRAVGKHVRRRRLLDVRRSDRSRRTSTPRRRAATSAASTARPTRRATSSRCRATRKASCASTGTRRST